MPAGRELAGFLTRAWAAICLYKGVASWSAREAVLVLIVLIIE